MFKKLSRKQMVAAVALAGAALAVWAVAIEGSRNQARDFNPHVEEMRRLVEESKEWQESQEK